MLKSLETALRLSEIREKLNDLNAIADQTEAQQTEERDLLASQKACETEYRESLQSEADEHATVPVNGEDREYRALLARGNVGRILAAFVEHRSADGPNRRSSSITGWRRIRSRSTCCGRPSSIARSRPDPRTSARPSNRRSCRYSRRASGRSSRRIARPSRRARWPIPVLDQRPTVGGPHTDSSAVDETTGSFSSSLLTPGRVQASYFYRRTDAARFPVIDLALRQALNGGLEEKLDQELIAGTEGC